MQNPKWMDRIDSWMLTIGIALIVLQIVYSLRAWPTTQIVFLWLVAGIILSAWLGPTISAGSADTDR